MHMEMYVRSYALGKQVTGWDIERFPSWKEHTRSERGGSNSDVGSTTKNVNPNRIDRYKCDIFLVTNADPLQIFDKFACAQHGKNPPIRIGQRGRVAWMPLLQGSETRGSEVTR